MRSYYDLGAYSRRVNIHALEMSPHPERALRACDALRDLTPDAGHLRHMPSHIDLLCGDYHAAMVANDRAILGKWRELLDEPLPDDQELHCVTTAMLHYGKGVAHAALAQLADAEAAQRRFVDAYARVPQSRKFFNNKYTDILAIAAAMLQGEIEYRKGDYDRAFVHLRTAVRLDDDLPYDEPWGWMQPVRHALGALLLEQSRVEEAVQVYRADLGLDDTLSRPARHPNNVWSLHGYVECLHRLGKHDEAKAMQTRLDLAMGRADVQIRASCFCRASNGCCE